MSVGVILTLSPSRQVIHRKPVWPWPAPGEYPRLLPNGNIEMFFPKPYYHFALGDLIHENHSS